MPSNCDAAVVTVTVLATPITAAGDYAHASSKVANTAVANVLANDRLGGAAATLANVTLKLVSLTPANTKIRLDLTDGSVDVLGKTSSGVYLLVYEICEIAMPTNCARATVTLDLSGGI
jgi:large repetitive protein